MTFASVYDDISNLVDKMNVTDNEDRTVPLYQLMEYICTHAKELIQHFDYRLTTIIQSIYYKIESADQKDVLDKLDEYLKRLEPMFNIKEDEECYDLTYWGYEKETPAHYEKMKLLIQYIEFVMLKVWPEKNDVDVRNINTLQDFYMLTLSIAKDCY